MTLAGAEHRDRVPVGRLDDDGRRRVGHLGGLAAHHAAEPDHAGVVGDHEVLGGQLPVGAVEGGQPLALVGTAYDEGSLEPVAVVAVDRPADLEHHVVGDVDGQRDRPHPGQADPRGQPVGRGRGRVEAGDRAGDEDRAAGGVLDPHRVAVVVGGRHLALRRVGVGRVEARSRPRVRRRAATGRRPGRG